MSFSEGYTKIHVGESTPAQQKKFLKTKKITLTKDQVKSNSKYLLLHPLQAKLVKKAALQGKGVTIQLSPGELAANIEKSNKRAGKGLEGGGFFDWIKNKAIPWIQKNASWLKPVASTVMDIGATLVPAAAPIRQEVKKLTGVGIKKKSKTGRKATPAQLAALAKGRAVMAAKRAKGGSFKPAGY